MILFIIREDEEKMQIVEVCFLPNYRKYGCCDRYHIPVCLTDII
jgi:hypothetical protein